MSSIKKLSSIILSSAALILFLFLVSTTASASITETRITNSGTASNPAIYGNTIVWEDNRDGIGGDIYMYDITTKKETRITNVTSWYPDIYDSKVVWMDWRTGSPDVYMYDVTTKKETRITTSGTAHYPAIYGNRIVWQDNQIKDSISDIYMYDISTKEQTRITTRGDESPPTIYDSKIVWAGVPSGPSTTIMVYDIPTKKETQITTGGFIYVPAIYSNRIVWDDLRNNFGDIYMYDLSTMKETQVTSNSSSSEQPDIYGNTIVWQDNRNGNWDIYAYDLITHQQIHTTSDSDQVAPAIYGNKIVWLDNRSGSNDIYMGTISYLPKAAFTAFPTTGNLPLDVQFADQSTDVYYWHWDFGDGTTSIDQNPLHTYSKAGNYTVTLTVSNAAGNDTEKKKGYVSVNSDASNLVASFSASPTTGNAPLNVAFTDTSTGSPISWNWNFGDGTTSNLQNPTNTYSSVGSHTVTLTVSDANGITSSQTSAINILEQSSSSGSSDNGGGSNGGSGSDDSSSGGSSGGSSSGGSSNGSSGGGGGGGGAGGSPEPQSNVEIKELSQTFVGSGQSVNFDFPQKVTPVVYVSFDSKKTAGKITTIAELLKEKSTLVSELPSDEVYKHLNIWVGNSGFATPENIENAVVGFKVEKSWVEDNNINQSSIALNRYSDNKWEQLQTSQSEEDDSYLYFTAKTQGFSEFAITGKTKAEEAVTELQSETDIKETETELQPETEIQETETKSQLETDIKETETESQLKTDIKDIGQNKMSSDVKQANEQKGKTSIPGFEIVYGIIGLLGIFLSRRRL